MKKTQKTVEKLENKIKAHFEANMLDGDDVKDCGGAMISAETVLEYMTEFFIYLFSQKDTEWRERVNREIDGAIKECEGGGNGRRLLNQLKQRLNI